MRLSPWRWGRSEDRIQALVHFLALLQVCTPHKGLVDVISERESMTQGGGHEHSHVPHVRCLLELWPLS